MSSVSPDLHGDIKSVNNAFLLSPASRIDLTNLRSSRNFWVYINPQKAWSATGVSKNLKQLQEDTFQLDAGLLWHKVTRENKNIGLEAEVFSFVPSSGEPLEVMQVKITNTSRRAIKFIPTAAIPIYGRGANNLRDHRHVTSLLQRITLDKYGVICKPTLSFDEAGHRPNKTLYFVLGWDERGVCPQYLYPTQETFCGEQGDLEAPESILKNLLPSKIQIQGREAMGALRFKGMSLRPGESHSYIIVMGITENPAEIKKIILKFKDLKKVRQAFDQTKDFWLERSYEASVSTADPDFDNWFHWVSIQPTLRRIFGCSFLPDFDYGKGGRGWRDLWQDCLSLILTDPVPVRPLLINNFSGVRIDGSNATIIGKIAGEFIADRNDIARVWMDHGVWPLLTVDLYINETADTEILFEETTYFRDQHIFRSRCLDKDYSPSEGNILKASSGRAYKGTILEHLILQNLTQFFNVGLHNHVRLEGADWNDGLDMAWEFGESVAFSAMYAHNLKFLSELILKAGKPRIQVAEELKLLFGKVNYGDTRAKNKLLEAYFNKVKCSVSGKKISLGSIALAKNLREKSEWMMQHIRKSEWLREGFFNGYYDNNKKRVEGRRGGSLRMTLPGQVFPIMSGVAEDKQIISVNKSVNRLLFDKKLGGFRLNTDFGEEQLALGRAFSFVYGDKENGAVFNHMVVMYAFALYKRGFAKEAWQVLSSIYRMAINTARSKIYPCLPEYFNLEGRGMYAYLTGSASWYVLTLLTGVFGVKGKNGDLFIEPKLSAEQFKKSLNIGINRFFAGRRIRVNFYNPERLDFGKYKITHASLNAQELFVKPSPSIIISRKTLLRLPAGKTNILNILLG